MRVVALYRVSTEKQLNEGASLDAQQRRFRELAAASGWVTVAEFRGQESAAKAASERAVLQQVLAAIRGGDVDAVWVYEHSRLTRGDELEVALLLRELRERGVRLIVQGSVRDLNNADDNFTVGIDGLLSRREWQLLKERTERGRREKARQGKKTAGGAPFGYRNPPPGDPRRGVLQVEPSEANVVRRIFAATASGITSGRLVDQLNLEGVPSPKGGRWGKTTIARMLKNPVYLGTQVGSCWVRDRATGNVRFEPHNPRAILVEGAHEALVTREQWEAARAQRVGSSNGLPGMLTGLLWVDGQRVEIDRSEGRSYYRRSSGGGGPWVPVDDVNAIIWRGFVGLVSQGPALASLMRRADRERPTAGANREELAARRDRLMAKLARLVDMRADGEITREMFAERSEDARRQLASLEPALAAASEREAGRDVTAREELIAACAALAAGNLALAARRRLIKSLVTRVDVQLGDGPQQARGKGGQYAKRKAARWVTRDAFLHLHRCPAPYQLSALSVRPWVTVQVVAGGRLLPAAEAIRRALRGVA